MNDAALATTLSYISSVAVSMLVFGRLSASPLALGARS